MIIIIIIIIIMIIMIMFKPFSRQEKIRNPPSRPVPFAGVSLPNASRVSPFETADPMQGVEIGDLSGNPLVVNHGGCREYSTFHWNHALVGCLI